MQIKNSIIESLWRYKDKMAVAQEYKQGTLRLASAPIAAIKGPDDDDDGLDGLDDLIRGHAVQKVNKRRKVIVSKNIRRRKLNNLLVAYEQYLGIDGIPQMEFVWRNFENNEVLTPLEINAFLQMTIEYENCERSSFSNGIGYFISPLIQNSYNAGYNKFVLDTSNFKEKIDKLGWFIKGRRDKSINIKVVGDLGDDCFVEGKYVSAEIYGNVGRCCGNDVKYSYFKIDGSVDEWCGNNAKHSYFIIDGNAKGKCGYRGTSSSFVIKGDAIIDINYFFAENSSYQLGGELNGDDLANMGRGCINSEFLTSNKRTLKKLLDSKIKSGDSNKIYFIDKKGKKILILGN